jgi:hypothetical protein
MENPVLETTRYLLKKPKYVNINDSRILQLAEEWRHEEFNLPKWDLPVYPAGKTNDVIDFFFLTDSINFAFTDFETKEKFEADYEGKSWRGAMGMTACLSRALDRGYPILDAKYLKDISRGHMEEIFKGNMEIPMLDERLEIFHEVGNVLEEKYGGHFHNLVHDSNNHLFNYGKGMVERLVNDFPSFDDSVMHAGQKISFNKRAQLAAAMVYERFEGELPIEDIHKSTIFADYVLPKGLRDLGVLQYEDSLAKRVDNQEIIPSGSLEELEIRASTIHAADLLTRSINLYHEVEHNDNINALHMDAKLWLESRGKDGFPHHLTPTIAY